VPLAVIDQAVIAIENARLFDEERLRLRLKLGVRDFEVRGAPCIVLGGPGLKFQRHFAQPPGDPEIKGGSGYGRKNFRLLTQVCTADHEPTPLFQVSDIGPVSVPDISAFRSRYLGINLATLVIWMSTLEYRH
jgi:hypothetical protein